MVRKTSVEAYDYIRASGVLGERQMRAYDCLYSQGPLTARELSDRAGEGMWKRLSELKEMGLVEEVGEVKDPDTRMTVILWDVTGEKPRAVARKVSAEARLRLAEAVVRMLRDHVAEMAKPRFENGQGNLF